MSIHSTSKTSEVAENQKNDSHISQSFRDQKQIESFIRSNKLLKIIEGVADQYVKTFVSKLPEDALAAVIVPLHFTYADFLTRPIDLLHLAVEEPTQFADATKYCVYGIVRDFVKQSSVESGLKSIDINQVHVQLRFIGLPLQQDLIFDPSENLYRTGLSLVVGILSAWTEQEKCVYVFINENGCVNVGDV